MCNEGTLGDIAERGVYAAVVNADTAVEQTQINADDFSNGGLLAECYAMIGSIDQTDFDPNYAFKVAKGKNSYLSGRLTVADQVEIGMTNHSANGLLTVHGIVSADGFQVNGQEIGGKWLDDGSGDIYYNDGSVGIGTDAPQSALDVRGAISFRGENEALGFTLKDSSFSGFFPLGGLETQLRFIVGTRKRANGELIGEGFEVIEPQGQWGNDEHHYQLTDSSYRIVHVISSVVDEEATCPMIRSEIIEGTDGKAAVKFNTMDYHQRDFEPQNLDFSFLLVIEKV